MNNSTVPQVLGERVDVGDAGIDAARRDGQRARRRRSTIGAALRAVGIVAVVVATVFVLGPGNGGEASPITNSGHDDGSTMTIEARSVQWAGYDGVYIGAGITFDSARGLDDGYFQSGADRYPVHFWTEATDCDCEYPDPLPVHPGERVLIETTSATPDCSTQPAASVELVVSSRMPDGRTEVSRFSASNPAAYANAVDAWCALTDQ